jgi:hypothetical protein
MLFSIRQDALHHLLELERCIDWSQISESLLDRQIRYQLRNFSISQSQAVISNLTSNCHYYIEPALVDQLVSDLADEYAEIPPAQLQVIGAQLQAENVKTLGQYFKLGPKPQQYLIERALEEAIRDCGKQNLAAVVTALFLLTDSRGNRPQRTFSQLIPATTGRNNSEKLRQSNNISTSSSQHNYYAQLLLLLNILVGSGLIACTKSEPEYLYQLVHDDLVETIRSKYLAQQQEPAPGRRSRITSQNRSMIRTSRIHARKGQWSWVRSIVSGVQQLVETVPQHPVWNNISTHSMAVIDRTNIGVTNMLKSVIALVVRKKS